MRESEFRRYIVNEIRKAGGHASPVESHDTSPGVFDIDYTLGGTNGHLELKVWTETRISAMRISAMRSTQVKWAKARMKAGDNNLHLILGMRTKGGLCVWIAAITPNNVDAFSKGKFKRETRDRLMRMVTVEELLDTIAENRNCRS